jgi:LmbE family N-acetylglucosaminyl deacetylase
VTPLTDVGRVLAIVAHPDDLEFGCAGTIASWTKAGIEVAYCVATDGDAGGFDETPRAEMKALRRAEQRAAAEILGVSDVTFLGYPDGALYVTHPLRRDLTREIRRFRPDRVLTTSAERNWSVAAANHGDHVRLGEAAYDAVYPDARNPFAHPELLGDEGLEPWTVREVWVTAGPDPDHAVDVTDLFETKMAALRAHASQTAHQPELGDAIRAWMDRDARTAGLPPGRLAETFTVLSTA